MNKIAKNETTVKKEYAVIERHYMLSDGLFKPKVIKEADRRMMNHIIDFKVNNKNGVVEWMGIQLDAFDMQVYIVLSKLASTDKTRKEANGEKEESIYNLIQIDKNGKYVRPPVIYVETSLYEICTLMGYADSGQNLAKILKSLKIMSCIKVYVYSKDENNKKIPNLVVGSSLIGNLLLEKGNLTVAFNPMVASMIDGRIDGCTVDLESIRKLKTDVSKKLIFWLSAWASYDRVQKIGIDKLVNHVWSEDAPTPELKRKRKFKIRESLDELKKLNWFIRENEDIIEIKRPKY